MTRVISKDADNSTYTGATIRTEVAGVNLALGYQTAGYNTATSNYTSTFVAANTKLVGYSTGTSTTVSRITMP